MQKSNYNLLLKDNFDLFHLSQVRVCSNNDQCHRTDNKLLTNFSTKQHTAIISIIIAINNIATAAIIIKYPFNELESMRSECWLPYCTIIVPDRLRSHIHSMDKALIATKPLLLHSVSLVSINLEGELLDLLSSIICLVN